MGDCRIEVWDLEGEGRCQKLDCNTPSIGWMSDADLNGDVVFTAGGDNAAVRVFSLSSGEQKANWTGPGEESLYSCTIVETPSLLGVAGTSSWNGNEVRFFDINTCKPAGKIKNSYEGRCEYMFADPINQGVFFLVSGGKIQQYDARAKKKLRTLTGTINYGSPNQIQFPVSSGGKFVASCSNEVYVFDSNTGKILYHGSKSNAKHVAALASNLLTIGVGGRIHFFDINNLKDKELNFDASDNDIGVPGEVAAVGAGLQKIWVNTYTEWKTISNPSLK